MKTAMTKKPYCKPAIERVRLAPSEEVLATGCKNSGLANVAPTSCEPLSLTCSTLGS